MSIYSFLMIAQVICLVLVTGCLAFCYMEEKEAYRNALTVTLLSSVLLVGGYALFLQTTDLEGLRVAQKVYLLGKIIGPTALFFSYISILHFSKYQEKYHKIGTIMVLICITAVIFAESDFFQKYLFTEISFEQNQYFYYVKETKTYLSTLFMIYQFVVLFLCSFLVMFQNKSVDQKDAEFGKQGGLKKQWKKLILMVVPIFPILAELISALPVSRHYDVTSLAVTLSTMAIFMILPLKI